MKFRLIVSITASLIFCAIVSAQPNNCCGIDRNCTTDKEWSDGFWAFQNNQCGAPAQMTQIQQPVQPAQPATGQIDNCCFVDRQCTTGADWDSGYWAFQNNQCSAPTQRTQIQQPAQPAQPAAPAPQAQIDNCCFVDRQCTTNAEWTRGYQAFQNNQCHVTEEHGGAVMSGGQSFYEMLGAETLTTDTVLLTRGTWAVTLITAAAANVSVASVDIPGCLSDHASRVFRLATGTRTALAWKNHNLIGGNNEANGRITVHRDCNVSFYVWAPRHTWSLKLSKT